MTWHPTTNRIQTVHLTPEERAALEAWPHGIEFYDLGAWSDCKKPIWHGEEVYRGKTPTVVTSVWFNQTRYDMYGPYNSRHDADIAAPSNRIDVLRIDTCNGVSTAYLVGLK